VTVSPSAGPTWIRLNDSVSVLAVRDGVLIAGGRFTAAGRKTANHFARWDGTAW
jgi:hypothetical protein